MSEGIRKGFLIQFILKHGRGVEYFGNIYIMRFRLGLANVNALGHLRPHQKVVHVL